MDCDGRTLALGVYFCRLLGGGQVRPQRPALMKEQMVLTTNNLNVKPAITKIASFIAFRRW